MYESVWFCSLSPYLELQLHKIMYDNAEFVQPECYFSIEIFTHSLIGRLFEIYMCSGV